MQRYEVVDRNQLYLKGVFAGEGLFPRFEVDDPKPIALTCQAVGSPEMTFAIHSCSLIRP